MTSLGISRSIVFVLSVILSQPTDAAQSTTSSPIWDDGAYLSCAITDCFVPVSDELRLRFQRYLLRMHHFSFVTQVATCLGQNCSAEFPRPIRSTRAAVRSTAVQPRPKHDPISHRKRSFIQLLEHIILGWISRCSIGGCLVPLTAASGCEVDDHECVCLNSTLLLEMAGCIGKACTNEETKSVYTQYSSSCSANGGYSLNLSSSQWLSAAGPGTVSEPSSSSGGGGGGGGGGLTKDQQIAIGVGLGMGLPSIFTSLFLCLRGGRYRGGRGPVYEREIPYYGRVHV